MSNFAATGNVDLSSRVSVAVARKSLDAAQQQGEAAVSLIRSAAEITPARQGAVTATPSATETGQNLDVTA